NEVLKNLFTLQEFTAAFPFFVVTETLPTKAVFEVLERWKSQERGRVCMMHGPKPPSQKIRFTPELFEKYLNCLQENRLKVNSEREQDSPIEMGASNISRFKEMPFLKAKRHRAHSVVSGVRVKASKQKTIPRLGIISARRHRSNP
ncbi:hypothetical protein TNCV_1851891, partial [Trichonephila clavipes]